MLGVFGAWEISEEGLSHSPTAKGFGAYGWKLALALAGWDGVRAFRFPLLWIGWCPTVPPFWFNIKKVVEE